MDERSYSTSVTEPYGVVVRSGEGEEITNLQSCITITPPGTWICTWTRASTEGAADQSVVAARSKDQGRTWSDPVVVEGPIDGPRIASCILPFTVPHTGRIYAFFWWSTDPDPVRDAGHIYMRYSDDDGLTWSRRYPPWSRRYPLPRPRHAAIDEEGHQMHGWSYGVPKIMPNGEVVFTFAKIRPSSITPWLRAAEQIARRTGNPAELHNKVWHTHAFLMVGRNLLAEPDPQKLEFAVLPEGDAGLHVRMPSGVPTGDELSVEALSNGDWLGTLRTPLGCIYFATSSDEGRTWTQPQPMRFCPGGPIIPHPCSSQPLVRLADGRFVLLFHNNAGDAHGGVGPWDKARVRTPLWALVGRELPRRTTGQRIVWGKPRIIVDNHIDFSESPLPCRTEINYPQLIEWAGRCFVCYCDRKRDVLINEVAPALLDDFGLPV